MNFFLRNFFYSIGLCLLSIMSQLHAETAQFRDLVAVFHNSNFWNLVGAGAVLLCGLEFAFSGGVGGASGSQSALLPRNGNGDVGSKKEATSP